MNAGQYKIHSTNNPVKILQFPELGESCLNKFSLDIYMPTVVGLMSFNTMLCLFLALSSGKGVIWDENPKSRKFVSPLFHLCLVLGIAEMILVTYGTKQISGALNSTCAETQSEKNSMYVILVLIIFKWLGIVIILLIFIGSLKGTIHILCKLNLASKFFRKTCVFLSK